MKIIATTGNDRFLVEATNYELANVMGYGYPSELKNESRLAVGKEIPVSKLWQALSITRSREEEVAKLAEGLRKLADRVDGVNATLAAPIVEVKEQ